MTVFEDLVYWTDWNTHAIYQADKFNGSNPAPVTSTNLVSIPWIRVWAIFYRFSCKVKKSIGLCYTVAL